MKYVYYTTDDSFDYDGPFGTETYYDVTKHGFELNEDKDFNLVLSSLMGFGDFAGIEDDVKSWRDFLKFLEEHKIDISGKEDSTQYQVFEELEETTKYNSLKEAQYERIFKKVS